MKTYASLSLVLLLLAASASCAPSQASADASKVEKVPPVKDVRDGYNIIPLYEIKEVPPHASTNAMCSPKCYTDVYKKPVYLVMRSDDSKEYEAVYLEEGLKSYKPRDKAKSFDVDGKAVGMVFAEWDFPRQRYPHVYEKSVKDPESRRPKAPFVVIANEVDLKEVNRREEYERVAEMEVSVEGFIREIKTTKKRADDRPFDLLDARNANADLEGKFPSDPNTRSNFQDLVKLMSVPPYRPFYPPAPVYDNIRNYFSYPYGYDPSFYRPPPQQNNPYAYPGYKPQYFNAPYSYEYVYDRYPGYVPYYEPYKANDPGYFPKPWYPHEYGSYNYGGASKYPGPYDAPRHPYPAVPYNPTAYRPFDGYGFRPNAFKNTYDPYLNKYFPNFPYDRFQNDPVKYYPDVYPSRFHYDSGRNYVQNSSSRDPVRYPGDYYPHFPHYYYPGPYSPEVFSSESYPSQYYYQSGNTNFPPKYAFSNRSPALTYVLNICHGHRAGQSPPPVVPAEPHRPEPEPGPVVHSPTLKTVSPAMRTGIVDPSGEFYKPGDFFRSDFYRPDWTERDGIRRLVRPQPEENEGDRPFRLGYSSSTFLQRLPQTEWNPFGMIPFRP